MNIFERYVLDIEAHIVPRKSLLKASWCISTDFASVVKVTEAKVITMQVGNTSLCLAYRDGTNTTNFVDILEGQLQ